MIAFKRNIRTQLRSNTMTPTSYQDLAQQLRSALRVRGLTQRGLAAAVQEDPARISRLLTDLQEAHPRKDRLTLLLALCDVLRLAPVLVPIHRLDEVRDRLGHPLPRTAPDSRSAFDDLFVDLSDGNEPS